jgi:phosphate transport system protein
MTPYEERLQEDMTAIRESVCAVGETIEVALRDAVKSLLTYDRELAAQIVLGDLAINRTVREIDHKTHQFVAVHLPSAGHLRFVSSVLRLNVELERVGDYAAAIAREVLQLKGQPGDKVAKDIELMSDQTGRMLHEALRAFAEANADLARGTKVMADQIESTYQRVFDDLLGEGETGHRSMREMFGLLVVFNKLGRVGAQAKNMCEETIFACTGETKAPKVYRILFIDEANTCRSQIAEAVARRTFPESGAYHSAGWQAGEEISPALLDFLESKGLPSRGLHPKHLPSTRQELGAYHVIVSLQGDVPEHLAEIPYRVLPLQWDIAPCPGKEESQEEGFARVYRELAIQIRELMVALRGEEAN